MPDPTITVEDGTGLTASNAYIDVADTEVRIEKQKEFSAWKNLQPNDQVLAIIAAAQYLDIHFRFYGSVLFPDQALQWPRTKNFDIRGVSIQPGVIPDQLLESNARLALEWGRIQTGLVTRQEGSGAVKSWKADGVEVQFDTEGFAGSALLGTRFTQVELILRSIGARRTVENLETNFKTETAG